MARGRMISKSLSTSERWSSLHRSAGSLAEFCQVLFMLLVAHADDHGRLEGGAFTVKHLVVPTSPRKESDVTRALTALDAADLIQWYELDGCKYIQINQFGNHQSLRGHEDRASKYPTPPTRAHLRPSAPNCTVREENLTEEKGTEENRTQLGADAPRNLSRFEQFWQHYPKKKSKDAARKAFEKRAVSDDLLARILSAIAQQKQSREWLKDGGQYIPHPATWLNAAGWEDELAVAVPRISEKTQKLIESSQEFLRS